MSLGVLCYSLFVDVFAAQPGSHKKRGVHLRKVPTEGREATNHVLVEPAREGGRRALRLHDSLSSRVLAAGGLRGKLWVKTHVDKMVP